MNGNENENEIRKILMNFNDYFPDGLVIKNTTYRMDEKRQIEKATRARTIVLTVAEAIEMISNNLSVIETEMKLNK